MTNDQSQTHEHKQETPTPKRLAFSATFTNEACFTVSLHEGGSGDATADAAQLDEIHASLEAGEYDDEIINALYRGKPVALRYGSKRVLGWLDLVEGEGATVDVSEIETEDGDQ